MLQKLLLSFAFLSFSFMGIAQDNNLRFTIDGKKYELKGDALRTSFKNLKERGYKYSELTLSSGFVKVNAQTMMVTLAFLEADGMKPSKGAIPVSNNTGFRGGSLTGTTANVPLAYFRIDMHLGTGFAHYSTNDREDGSIEITSVEGNVFEGTFSLTLTELTSKEKLVVKKGSFRLVLKD
jgi:hypothetical protein